MGAPYSRHRGHRRAPGPLPSDAYLDSPARGVPLLPRPVRRAPAPVAAPGPGQLRAPVGDQAGEGGGRHQGLPLPRPGTAAPGGGVDVGPQPGDGHRHPPEHRLPLPDGPLLLVGPGPPRPHLGRPAHLDGDTALCRRDRVPVLRPAARPPGAGPGGRRPGLHRHPLPHRLPGPHLGHPHALGRPGLDAGAGDPGAIPAPWPWSWPWSAGSTPPRSSSSDWPHSSGWPTRCGSPGR
jgi:translation initiation factor IF-2